MSLQGSFQEGGAPLGPGGQRASGCQESATVIPSLWYFCFLIHLFRIDLKRLRTKLSSSSDIYSMVTVETGARESGTPAHTYQTRWGECACLWSPEGSGPCNDTWSRWAQQAPALGSAPCPPAPCYHPASAPPLVSRWTGALETPHSSNTKSRWDRGERRRRESR